MINHSGSLALTLCCLALAPSGSGKAKPERFERLFVPTTVRAEINRSGYAGQQSWSLSRIGLEGVWAGPRRHLIDDMNLGQLAFELRDAESDELLFSRGFSSLYGEWLSTAPALKGERRSGMETLRFPLPRESVVLCLLERGANGRFETRARFPLDPQDYALAPWPQSPEQVDIIDVVISGPLDKRVDLLVVGDGYPDDQAEKFRRDLERLAATLSSEAPWSSAWHLFNLRGLREIGRTERGPAEPRKRVFPRSALTSFDTFASPRYLCPTDFRRLEDLAGRVPHDVLIVLVNTARYGGGGVFRQFTVSTADGEFDAYLFLHEFGHGFAGLGDEYFTSDVAYENDASQVEPWEPNLTRHPSRALLKWGHFVSTKTPLPTPDQAAYDGVVGAFEGGGYLAKGVFRPTRRCKMKNKGAVGYCPVCSAAIERMIAFTADLDRLPAIKEAK